MDIEVIPASISQANWQAFIDVIQKELGYSPIRGLDDSGISIKDPASFVACLDLLNNPKSALRNTILLQHCYATFIVICDIDTVIDLTGIPVSIYVKEVGRNRMFCHLAASIRDWKLAITSPNLTREARYILDTIKQHLSRTEFRLIFED